MTQIATNTERYPLFRLRILVDGSEVSLRQAVEMVRSPEDLGDVEGRIERVDAASTSANHQFSAEFAPKMQELPC